MNEQEKLIEEQFKILSPDLQQAISSLPWKSLVQEIGKANFLDAEQMAALEQETMFILYAFENPNDYVTNIIKEVGLSEEVANSIADSVAEKIFEPILEKIETHEENSIHNLPMIEEGEMAHDVPHIETMTNKSPPSINQIQSKTDRVPVPLPDYRYEGGKDPYREPLG